MPNVMTIFTSQKISNLNICHANILPEAQLHVIRFWAHG